MASGLTPTIEVEAEIPVELDGGAEIHAEIVGGAVIEADLVASGPVPDYYSGEYVVTPDANDEQTLETKGLVMQDNVIVLKVPYFETSNPFGHTIYIASEV